MPGSYLLDAVRHVVFLRVWGALTDADIDALVRALYADPRFDARYALLEDYRSVSSLGVSASKVRDVAGTVARNPEHLRVFVVGSDVSYGVMRMLELASDADPDRFKVCRDLAEAMQWVGLAPTTAWPEAPPDFRVGPEDATERA